MFTGTRRRLTSSLVYVAFLLFAFLGVAPGAAVQAQDLNLSINANKSSISPGGSVTYTVHVSNSGTSEVTGIQVEVELPGSTDRFRPEGTSDPANVSSCGSFCEGGETLTWTVGALSGGQSRILAYRTIISSSAPNATITTTSTLLTSGVPESTEIAEVVIENGASVTLGLGSERSPVESGERFLLRVNYGSIEGRGGAGFGELRLVLPPDIQFLDASGSGTESGGVVSWTLGPIPGGFNGSETVTVRANTGLPAGTLLDLRAELDPGNTGEPVARTAYSIPVHPVEPLRVSFSASDVPTVQNTRADFAITVSNVSSSTIQGSEIQFLLPDFLEGFRPESTSDPSGVSSCGSFCDSGEFMRWTPGDLEPGQIRTLFFETTTRNAAFGGALQRFFGLITAPGFAEQAPTYQYGFKTGPVLTVGLDAESSPVPAGGTFRYRITTGVLDFSSGADDATLQLELPDGVSFVSATGSPTVTTGGVQWEFGPLGAGFSSEQTVTVEVSSSLSDGDQLKARVTFDPGTFGESIVQSSLVTSVAPERPIDIALTTNDTPANSGTRVDYALTVSNDTQFPVTDVAVTFVLGGFLEGFRPESTNDPSGVLSCGSFCNGDEILIWEAGALTAGESRTLYFETEVNGPGGDLSRFRGLANASRGPELIFTPNIAIDSSPVMSFGVAGQPRPVLDNEQYAYTLNYGAYAGAAGASNATMQLLLPEGVTPISTNGGTVSGNTVEWNIGPVGAGDGGRRILDVEVDDAFPEGSLLIARATLSSGNVGEMRQRTSFPLSTLSANPLQLTVTAPDSPVQPSQQVTYDIEIENTGSTNIASPRVEVVLPGFIESFRPENTNDGTNVLNCGSFCSAGEIFTWTPPDLTPGQTRTLSFTTDITSSNVLGDILRMRLEASGAGASKIYQTVNTSIANGFTIPVEMATFTASASGESVTLNWDTVSETNNAGFDIERSTDGETFATVASRPGAGTTTEVQTYRFVDRDLPFAPELFYRLRQVDVDGSETLSDVVSVQLTPTRLELLPSAPNPFAQAARLRYRLPDPARVRLEVFDLLGRRVATLVDGEKEAGPHEVQLDGSRLAAGTYFVRLTAGPETRTQQIQVVR